MGRSRNCSASPAARSRRAAASTGGVDLHFLRLAESSVISLGALFGLILACELQQDRGRRGTHIEDLVLSTKFCLIAWSR